MKEKINSKLEEFFQAAQRNKTVTNAVTQTQIAEADFYRQKYSKILEKFAENSQDTSEKDWEEALRRKKAESENEDFQDAIKTRKQLKWVLLSIIVIWLIFVGIIIVLQGFNVNIHISKHHIYFNLADSVMNVLLGTTTASVFGLYKVVINYFFKRN